jgi:hypothetical protein
MDCQPFVKAHGYVQTPSFHKKALEVIDKSNGLEALLIPLGKILSKLFMVRMMHCIEEIFRIHLDVVGRCTP